MRYIVSLLFLLFYISLQATTIDTIFWRGDEQGEAVNISEQVGLFVDSSGINIKAIQESSFKPSHSVFHEIAPTNLIGKTFFFAMQIKNETDDSLYLMLKVPIAEEVLLYINGSKKYAGSFSAADQRDERFIYNAFNLSISPGEVLVLKGKLNYTAFRRKGFSNQFYLQDAVYARNDYLEGKDLNDNYKFTLFLIAFLSTICFVFIFMLLHFVQTRNKMYLYYCLYLFTVIIYTLINFEANVNITMPYSGVFTNWEVLKHPLGIFVSIAYFYFINEFLDLKTRMPKLYSNFSKFIIALYVYVLIGIIIGPIMKNYGLEFITYFVIRFLWLIPSVWILVIIWRKQLPYGRIVLIGTSVLIGGSIISLVLSLKPNFTGFWSFPIIYTQFGIIIEILFFSLGIGKKMKDMEAERLKNKEALILQLVKNEKLQSNINLQLQEKVKIQAIKHEKELIEHKSVRLEKELTKMELLALRSQMNPHFIFNSLNSIKSYILKNGPLEASEYLTTFSNLIRSILQNSKSTQISLKDELETLILYVKLEMRRFPDRIEFSYIQNCKISLETIQVPPLILQPYVENAIWHGLLHLDTKGILKIEVLEEEGCIVVVIEDNGIGRKRSEELNRQSKRKYKSMGMGITQNRIDLHNHMNERGIKVDVQNVYDAYNTGTKVLITVRCNKSNKEKQNESNIN